MVDEPQLLLDRAGPLFDAQAWLRATLEQAFSPKQFSHHYVPARFSKASWAKLGERAPFVAIGFGGLSPMGDGGRTYMAHAVWQVFVGTKQPMPEAMLAGDRRAPGLLGMMGMAIAVLHGRTQVGLGAWSCGAAVNLYDDAWANDELGVVGIEANVNFQVVDDALAAALPDYLRQGIVWDLPTLPDQLLDVRT